MSFFFNPERVRECDLSVVILNKQSDFGLLGTLKTKTFRQNGLTSMRTSLTLLPYCVLFRAAVRGDHRSLQCRKVDMGYLPPRYLSPV